MKTIRYRIFETNSSSTHSLIILTKEEYLEFVDGKLNYDISSKKMLKVAPIIENILLGATKIDNGYIYENKYYSNKKSLIKNNIGNNIGNSYEELFSYMEVVERNINGKEVIAISIYLSEGTYLD